METFGHLYITPVPHSHTMAKTHPLSFRLTGSETLPSEDCLSSRVQTGTEFRAKKHYPALDGLRGLAVLLVLLYHFIESPVGTLTGKIAVRSSTLFWTGVDLFFVLSGFLITGILLDAKGCTHYFRNFYVRRCFRIFPLYYAFLVFVFVFSYAPVRAPEGLANYVRDLANLRSYLPWVFLYATNMFTALRGFPPISAIGHFWSLAVEEQFYLAWPAVILFLPRVALMRLCMAIMFLAPLTRWGLWQFHAVPAAAYTFTLCRMDSLALGALIAVAARDNASFRRIQRLLRSGCFPAVVTIVGLSAFYRSFAFNCKWVAIVGVTAAALLCGHLIVAAITVEEGWLARWLELAFMRSLGKYSYAIYVLHPLVAYLLKDWAFGHLSGLTCVAFMVVLGLPISYLLGYLSWHLFEKHFLRLRDLFPYESSAEQICVPTSLR
jgi:peptidoglycan/LPS O-acetylase OafA/YrhL